LGDTVITKLTDLPQWKDYLGSVKLDYPWNLKNVKFYQSLPEQQQYVYNEIIKPWLVEKHVIGVHRFEQFDFTQLDKKLKVLSIDCRQCLDYVAPLFIQKVQKVVGHYDSTVQHLDTVITQKYSDNHKLKIELSKRQILNWCNTNILPGDAVMQLEKFLEDPNYIHQFKNLAHA
jgi:hypothetical protein